MKTPTFTKGWIAALAVTIFTTLSGHAAVVTWGSASNITGDANVIKTGSLVGAFNIGDTGVTTATVNGVAFNPFAVPNSVAIGQSVSVGNFTLATADQFLSLPNGTFGSAAAPFTGLSAGYQNLLGSATLTATPAAFTLTMSGLTVNNLYQFQWFANTSGPGAQLHLATAGNTSTLNDNTTNVDGGLGQFAVGTFVADASSQVITFSPNGGPFQSAQLNGFQLRSVGPVPEPGSALVGMLTLGLCCSGLFSRRSREVATT